MPNNLSKVLSNVDEARQCFTQFPNEVLKLISKASKYKGRDQDFLQSCYAYILGRIQKYDCEHSLTTFIYLHTKQFQFDTWCKEKRERARLKRINIPERFEPCPSDTVSYNEVSKKIREVINKENEDVQSILRLRYEKGLPLKLVAKQLKMKQSSVVFVLSKFESMIRSKFITKEKCYDKD